MSDLRNINEGDCGSRSLPWWIAVVHLTFPAAYTIRCRGDAWRSPPLARAAHPADRADRVRLLSQMQTRPRIRNMTSCFYM
ncbi:hypothetical protein [Desulfonema ishimotonii]|uniref:hypothetical protein n=1 Tax=Desulfonema ishimotonii TaxID=45657 RepID=UPI000F56C3AE|nr:hypothetical protein [Desulfonema ishimotonii]